ncbi:MAG TPA: hypothetical protein VHT03_10800 [Rhizomicrobium sp.]|nr:hypothetical protein [Rhizomicrobium sp.]
MIAQCWLHIGTEKTGSTSIQTFLGHNRAALRARGWLYSEAAGNRNHYSLVAYSLDDERHDRIRQILGVGHQLSLDAFRRELIRALETEIAASGAATLVLSCELLATRLRRPDEIARLKALCDRVAENTGVIVYLRNQSDFLVSRYTNVIWEGGTGEFAFRARTAIADYALLLDRWSRVFGKHNLLVRRFEPANFPAGDVIGDFSGALGLDMTGLYVPPRANPSLDAESLAFLRGLNRRLSRRSAERIRPFRGAMVRVLQRRRGGTKFTIPRAVATRIENAYRDSNERVTADYFGSGLQPLFSPAVLVSKEGEPPPDMISAFAAIAIGGAVALGLVRDAFIRAGKRLLRFH